MVYNWDGKEAECFRLYVQERKSLDEVIAFWELRGFTPSKRAFQTQFKRWEFPSKHNPVHKNEPLIARIKELWEKNYTQKDMGDTLRTEGHQINDRELMRVRLRFQWFLRERRPGTKRRRNNESDKKKPKSRKAQIIPGNGLIDQLTNAILQEESSSEEEAGEEDAPHEPEPEVAPAAEDESQQQEFLEPEEVLRRQLRQQQMQVESDEKWRTRKRRRRTRGWAGLPADAPGEPPRFPSETTIDESKAYLSLDNKLYKEMRDQFQAICEEQGVMKKTNAGPEKWAQLLQRLIRENGHLAGVFRQEPEALQQSDAMWRPKNYKSLSLDVICQDVTKRMRVVDSRMGLPEAKTALSLNPEQARHVRSAFLAILKADHFTNRFEAGDEHWNSLKQQWVQESEYLLHAIVPADEQDDTQHATKTKAIEVLARDVMKRFRAQKDTIRPKHVHSGPGPGPAGPSVATHAPKPPKTLQKSTNTNPPPQNNTNTNMPAISASADLEIDPTLLLAASDASIFPQQQHSVASNQHMSRIHRPSNSFNGARSDHNLYDTNPHMQSVILPSGPLPIYFRLHPLSDTPLPNKTVWLSVLQAGTLAEVKTLAMREHPGTIVVRLEGLIVHKGDGIEREVPITIDDSGELNAFLGHVGGGKATFVVLLGLAGNMVGGGFM